MVKKFDVEAEQPYNDRSKTFPLSSSLCDDLDALVFSYSPDKKLLLSLFGQCENVLGVSRLDVVREGNLFLRHVHKDDQFSALENLERALRGEA